MDYLSGDWLAALQEAAERDPSLGDATRTTSLSVQQQVTDGPRGDVTFHVVLDHGTVRIGPGPLDDPDITITQPYHLAADIARGRASAQAAAMAGHVEVAGRIDRLPEQARGLEQINDIFLAVRAQTDF